MSTFKPDKNGLRSILTTYLDNHTDLPDSDNELVNQISAQCGIDTTIWSPIKHKLTGNIWTVNGKFGSVKEGDQRWKEAKNGQVKIEILYERVSPINRTEFINDLISTLSNQSPKVDKIKYKENASNLVLMDIPDHHLGRLAYGKETGDNYDIKIAVERFDNATDYFIDELGYLQKRHSIEKVLLPFGNDFFNYSYAKPFPQTSNGTPQESDIRYQKMFTIGANLAVQTIIKASVLSKVKVIIVPGNHDEELTFYLGTALYYYFMNNPNVEVSISPTPRKYEQFGLNMLGFSHGQYESHERLFANMTFEDQKMWGETKFKYMFTGHIHHTLKRIKIGDDFIYKVKYPNKPVVTSEDLNGIIFDSRASLTSNDYYEASRGYIHVKGAECPVFNKERGKIHTINYTLPLSIHQ